jgi:hypothetical protein
MTKSKPNKTGWLDNQRYEGTKQAIHKLHVILPRTVIILLIREHYDCPNGIVMIVLSYQLDVRE